MNNSKHLALKLAGVGSLALLLSTSAFADWRPQDQTFRGDGGQPAIESHHDGDRDGYYRDDDRYDRDGNRYDRDGDNWRRGDYDRDGAYRQEFVRGVVERVDFRRGAAWMRDERSGRMIRLDLRGDRRGRFDADDVRRGDFVELTGNWVRGGVFFVDQIQDIHRRRW